MEEPGETNLRSRLSAHIAAAMQLALQCPTISAMECILNSLNAPTTNGRFVFVLDKAANNCATRSSSASDCSLQPDRCTENLMQSGSSGQTIPQTPDETAPKPAKSGESDVLPEDTQRLPNPSAALIQLTVNRTQRLHRHGELARLQRYLNDNSNTMQPSDCNVAACTKFLDDLDGFQMTLIDLQLHPEIVSILTRLSKLKVAVHPATREVATRAMRKCKSLMQSCNVPVTEGVLFRSLVIQYQAVLQCIPPELYYLVENDQQLAHLQQVRNEPLSDAVRQCFEYCKHVESAAEFQNVTNIRILVEGDSKRAETVAEAIADIFHTYVPIPQAWQCTLLQNVRLIEKSKAVAGPQDTMRTKKIDRKLATTAKSNAVSISTKRAVVDVNDLEDDDSQISSTNDEAEPCRALSPVQVATAERRESITDVVMSEIVPSRLVDLHIECISLDEPNDAVGKELVVSQAADKEFLKLNDSVQDLIEDMAMQHPHAAVPSVSPACVDDIKPLADNKPVPSADIKSSGHCGRERRMVLKLTVNRAKKMRKHLALHNICERLLSLVPKNIVASECDLDSCASLLDDLNRFQMTKICLQLHPEIVSILCRLQHFKSNEPAYREMRARVNQKIAEFIKTCGCTPKNVYQFRQLVKNHQHVLQATPPELHFLVELVVHFNRLKDMHGVPLPENLRQCRDRCIRMSSAAEFDAGTNIRALIADETQWMRSNGSYVDVNDVVESSDEMIEEIFKTYVPLELAWHLTLLSCIEMVTPDISRPATTVEAHHSKQGQLKMEPASPSQLGTSWRQEVEVIELNHNQTVDLTTDSEDDDDQLLPKDLPNNLATEMFDASQYIRECVNSDVTRTDCVPKQIVVPQRRPTVNADNVWFEETQNPSMPSPPRGRAVKAKRKIAKIVASKDPDRTVILRHDFQPLKLISSSSRSDSPALKRKTNATVAEVPPPEIESIEFVIEDASILPEEHLEDNCSLLASIPLGTASQLREIDERSEAAKKQTIPPRALNFHRPTLYDDV